MELIINTPTDNVLTIFCITQITEMMMVCIPWMLYIIIKYWKNMMSRWDA